MAVLPTPEVIIDETIIQWKVSHHALDNRRQALSVRFTGGKKTKLSH